MTRHSPTPHPSPLTLRSRGFTLIELLVVIAIIVLLASVMLASLNVARIRGYDAQRVTSLREVQSALELYAADHNNTYPTGGWYSSCSGWAVTTRDNAVPGLVPTYIPHLPQDPQVNTSANTCCYLYASNTGAGYKYMIYNCPTSRMCGNGGTGSSLYDATYGGCSVYSLDASGNF